jgi:uncharacterized protein (DUF488 family)
VARPPPEILTVGHSNHQEDDFLSLLRSAGVERIVDVRANPRSRLPHFNRSPLAGALETVGIAYEHLGEELGGRRRPAANSPNRGWENESFRSYADHMASEAFSRGLARLQALAGERRTAIMCAEAWWVRCHRRLIADALTVRGWRVLHLRESGSSEEHELTPFARLGDAKELTYPARQTSLGV